MDEEQSDINTEIDWNNTYDYQIKETINQNTINTQNFSIQENHKKITPSKRKTSKKKIVIVVLLLILIISFLALMQPNHRGILLLALIFCLCFCQIEENTTMNSCEDSNENMRKKEDEIKAHEIQPYDESVLKRDLRYRFFGCRHHL